MSEARLAGDLNRGAVLVRLVTFGIPLVAGMFFHSLFNLADMIIVGRLGEPDALAAVNQASLINMIPMLIATGINNASIAVISRNFGMRNYARANANTLQSFIVLVGLALLCGIPSYIWASELNQVVGSSGNALGLANSYLEISSAGLFTMFALMQVTAVLRAGGNARWPMILLIGANAFNVILSWWLVHGFWIFPKMGVPGAAWGTVIARGVFAVFGLFLITRPKAPVRLVLRMRIRPRMIWNLTRIGFPSSLQYVVRVVAYGAILRYVNEFGESSDIQAALAIGLRLDMLATFTGVGWGAAAAAMVGQALGAGRPERAYRAGWYAVILNSLMLAAIGLAYYQFAGWLFSSFSGDATEFPEFARAHELGIEYLRISVYSYVFVGIGYTVAQALNGAGNTRTPLVLDTIFFLVIQVPLIAFVCVHHAEYGYTRSTLWWCWVGVFGIVGMFYLWVWKRGRWKETKIQ